jgi:peroxiredoxin
MKYFTFLLLFITNLSIAQVASSPEEISPLLIGEKLPELEIVSADNSQVELKSIFDKKPTVLLFYRGGWCPYCNTHLSDIQEAESEILDLGYQIVGISPDSPNNIKTTEEDKDIKYQLYSDSDGDLIKAMGIAYKAPEKYNNFLVTKSDGLNKETLLPVPSVFIVDTNGKIVFEYINPDYKTRMSGKLLLSVLKNL